jgi:transcriptional regulator with XRE-family HTH domain
MPNGACDRPGPAQFSEGRHAVSGASPTLRQRELGLRLRRLRTGIGMTVEEVADKLLCSPAKVSRMETAARRAAPRDVRDLCGLYGVDEAATAELMQLARDAREQGWWTQYEDLKLTPYIGLEQDASSITCYCMHYVPSLLQTEDYARAIIKSVLPGIDPKILEHRVAARLRRQKLLESENPPRYRALLDEAVLSRKVGDAVIMAAQIDRILDLARAGKVTVQVIPFEVGAYPAADCMFVLLEFDDPVLSPVVYVEGLSSSQYHERLPDVAQYAEAVERQRDLALSPRESQHRLEARQRAYLSE